MIGEESVEQIKVVEWLKQCHPEIPFMHLAGERKCSPAYGRMLKRMGHKAGVSDLFFPRSNKIHKGLFLELKSAKGKPTDLQLDFLCQMMSEGYLGIVCYGSKQAIDAISLFYEIKILS